MRHAYLILAHDSWEQLRLLVSLLDHPQNDLYIHIDKKVKVFDERALTGAARFSSVTVLRRHAIYWGSYEMTAAELTLLSHARARGYDYYHLLSGADLPLKTQDEIHQFFDRNKGSEFVQVKARGDRLHPEVQRRAKVYHVFHNLRFLKVPGILRRLFTLLDKGCMALQLALGVDRMRKYPELSLCTGSQWFSITDALAAHLLNHQTLIRKLFRMTSCSDELFVQTLTENSPFRDAVYPGGNLRFIRWAKGRNPHPRLLTQQDAPLLKDSDCLFARKFSLAQDPDLVYMIADRARPRSDLYNSALQK